jgi:His-Xaa-Ser system protein HxsD
VTDPQDTRPSRTVFFAEQLFKIDSVKKAAYRFSDRLSFEFLIVDGGLQVIVTPLGTVDASELGKIISKFEVEVLDNDLRLQIAEDTAPIRNAILAYAFSKTGLQDDSS